MIKFLMISVIQISLYAQIDFSDLKASAEKFNNTDKIQALMTSLNTSNPIKNAIVAPKKSTTSEKKVVIKNKATSKIVEKPKINKQIMFDVYIDDDDDINDADEMFIPDFKVKKKVIKTKISSSLIPKKKDLTKYKVLNFSDEELKLKGITLNNSKAFRNLQKTSSLLDSSGKTTDKIENIFNNYVNKFDNNSGLTIFYFVDSHMNKNTLLRFANEIERLRKYNKNIIGRILTVGLVITDNEKKSLLMEINKLKKVLLTIKKTKQAEKREVDEKIRKLFLQSQGNFDTHYRWTKELYEYGIKGVKVQFHPIAFQSMGVERVPAYLIARCESNFQFKTCRKDVFVRGDISLTRFYEIISDNDDAYRKPYEILINYD